MAEFKVGDRVQINDNATVFQGEIGTVESLVTDMFIAGDYIVRFRNGSSRDYLEVELEPAPSPEPEQDELPNCEACGNTRQMRASAPMFGEMLTPCPFCVPVNAAGDTTEVMWLRAEYHRLIAERDAMRIELARLAVELEFSRQALRPFAEKYRHALESNVALGMTEPAHDREYRVQYQHLKQADDALGE